MRVILVVWCLLIGHLKGNSSAKRTNKGTLTGEHVSSVKLQLALRIRGFCQPGSNIFGEKNPKSTKKQNLKSLCDL